jgi:hypothetical protein
MAEDEISKLLNDVFAGMIMRIKKGEERDE